MVALFWIPLKYFFCPEIKKSFDFFKENCGGFFPSRNSYSLSFCSQFGIPWILCWDFTTHNFVPSPFPQDLAWEFHIKWWVSFKISQSQTFESIKNWIDSKRSKKPFKKALAWSQPFPRPLLWPQTPNKNSFRSNLAYKTYLKRIQEQAAEMLS